MMSGNSLEEICNSYLSKPLDPECYKKISNALLQCTESERERFFETFHPKELHLQRLKVVAASKSAHHAVLLHGLNEESKAVSKHCLNSKLLYSSSTSRVYDPDFLLPLLQTVSRSTRNRLVWNLGKHMPEGCSNHADTLYESISKVWGTNVAVPLLCKASEALIQREISGNLDLSQSQLLIIAQRFPFIALAYLEKSPRRDPPIKAAKYIVRATVSKSFDYCLKKCRKQLLSISMNKIILRDYRHVVLEAPSKWINVLNMKCVKYMLTSEEFQLFLTKQFVQIEKFYVPDELIKYFKLLLPNQISQILKEAFKIRYGCLFDSKLEFWEENSELLCLLSDEERSAIALQLDAKLKGTTRRWVPLMTCDKSIPILKNELQTATEPRVRAALVSKLLETVEVNKDTDKLEEVCQFVAVRYRNDREVLHEFFNSIPDLSSVSSKTWSIVYGLASKFCKPGDWYTSSASKLFFASVKREGIPGLKVYLERFMSSSGYFVDIDELKNLREDLRVWCIDEVFTKENVESTDNGIQRSLSQFLPLLSKWNEGLSPPVVPPNVKSFIHNILKSENGNEEVAVEFVLNKNNGWDVQSIELCFHESQIPSTRILNFLLSRRSPLLNSRETATKIASYLYDPKKPSCGYRPEGGHIALVRKMKKLGYLDILQCIAMQSKAAISDPSRLNCQNAIFLLSLTTDNADDYFSIVDPFLSNADNSDIVLPPFKPEASEADIQLEMITQAKRRESICKGIGLSFSHFDLPSVTVDRLLKFCISGDLVLYVRDSLYSVCSSLPNVMAQKLLLSLMQRPISVKKHALRIHRLVCDLQTQQDFLLHLIEVENHLTTRTVLLRYAVDCLNNAKSAAMWQVVREMMKRLTSEDRSILVLLADLTVPDLFMEEYLQLLLEKGKLLKDVLFIGKIIGLICCHTTVTSERFLENLIREYFLSEIFCESIHCHQPVCDLLVKYLEGIQPSSSLRPSFVATNVAHRQQYLKELLTSNTSKSTVFTVNNGIRVKVFTNDTVGNYPIRSMLVAFTETFCMACLLKASKKIADVAFFGDILLDFISQFDQYVVFTPYVHLALTDIFRRSRCIEKSDDTIDETIGNHIGNLCDSVCAKTPELARYILPGTVAEYFGKYYSETGSGKWSRILAGIFPSPQHDETLSLLRLMVVAHVVPGTWRTTADYDTFRELFIPLVRNTPVETYLLNRD